MASSSTGGALDWQTEAWKMLDTVGELEFYRLWISNAMSRVVLKMVRVGTDDGETAVTDGPAYEALQELFGGEAGQSQMLATLASHLAIPGESWLFGIVKPDDTDPDAPDQWRVLSKSEVSNEGGRWKVDRGDGNPESYAMGDPETGAAPEALAIRIWRPHANRWAEANSSVRSALPILRELQGLTKHIAANIDSRLSGAGILALPSEMTFGTPVPVDGAEGDVSDPDADEFLSALTEAMMLARQDQGSAAAVVPIVVKAPGAVLANIKHLTFSTPLDEKSLDLRREAITRLASSLDVPAEVLTGMADVNHWTGWLLDENSIKMHVEPMVELITTAITTRYLWPSLQGDADTLDPTLRVYRIIGDTSKLRQKPDRSIPAQALHDDLLITDAARAREVGFTGDDLLDPNSDEYRRRILQRLAAMPAGPDVVAQALNLLGLTITPPPAAGVTSAEQVPPPTPPAIEAPAPAGPPARPDTPPAETGPPAQSALDTAMTVVKDVQHLDYQAAALVLGCEARVERAVERAWNRAGRRGRTRRPVASDQLDVLLDGAWDGVPRIAAVCGVDEARLRDALDTYTRSVLVTGEAHSPTVFARVLRERVLAGD